MIKIYKINISYNLISIFYSISISWHIYLYMYTCIYKYRKNNIIVLKPNQN